MSGTAIARHLLAANGNLIAVIPAARIFAGAIPINTVLPAIAVTQVSGVQRNTLGMNAASYMVTDRVQVTVLGKTYALQKSYMALVRAALPNTRGTVNGFSVDSILQDSDGPDMYDSASVIYQQSTDFMVRYLR